MGVSGINKLVQRPDLLYETAGKLFRYCSGKTCDSPVFIIGTGRCGTTLLVEILRTNKRVDVFPTEALDLFHPSLYPYGERKVECVPYWKDPELFTRTSIGQWPDHHALKVKDIFSGQFFLSFSARQLIVKSTMVIHMISEITELFEEAKFIHIYRHGIPFMNSYVRKEWGKYESCYEVEEFKQGVCSYWNDCIMEVEARKNDSDRPLNVLEISYEELCREPGRVMSRVAEYVGCGVGEFEYEYGAIENRNRDSGDIYGVKYREYLELMRPGLTAKGYV